MSERAREIAESKPRDEFRIRVLQRLPLGVSYVEQITLLRAMLEDPQLAKAQVFLDATGVGKPIADMFMQAGLQHTPIWITGGRDDLQHGNGWSVSKLNLISKLQAALHSGELRIAKELREANAFVRELQEFRASWTEAGNLRFGARQGAHDDLVLAAALGVYGATRLRQSTTIEPLSI